MLPLSLMIMNPEGENLTNLDGKDETTKPFKRHLQVNSVAYPGRKEIDWNRKAHSSPIKGYRRFSDQEESGDTNQVRFTPTFVV